MKKRHFLIILFIGLGIYACQKEFLNDTNSSENKISAYDRQIADRISSFIEKTEALKENPALKEGFEDLSLDDAVWFTEAALNFSHANYTNGYDVLCVDSMFVDIIIDADTLVDFGEVAESYWQMDENVQAFFAGLTDNNKHVLVVDVEPVIDELKSNAVTLKVTTLAGRGTPTDPPEVFGPDDNWWYGETGGRCDCEADTLLGIDVGRDAAYELQYRINHDNADPDDPSMPDHKYYFTNCTTLVQTALNFRNPDDPEIDNYFDYYLFYNFYNYDDFHKCLTPEEMNFYLWGLYNVIDSTAAILNDPELSFASCEVIDNLHNITQNISHQANITFGIKHTGLPH